MLVNVWFSGSGGLAEAEQVKQDDFYLYFVFIMVISFLFFALTHHPSVFCSYSLVHPLF